MAVILSDIVTQGGTKIVAQSIRLRAQLTHRLMVADQIVAAYLWSKQVTDQYPNMVNTAVQTTVSHEYAIGLLKNLKV
ncbi:MAG: hypothetical protein H0S85_04685 [Desulfovibrionaceae bacterium]|jgi:TnpA family transposase|nr:hypothetical protein [Desulfovibrionaceae bacterium]